MSDEQRCGTCRHWRLLDRFPGPLCLCPLPEWAWASGDQNTTATDGTNCDAWEAKR